MFVRKPFDIQNYFHEGVLGKGYELSNDTKISLQHENIAKNWIFHFQKIKRCCKVLGITSCNRQSCLCIFLEDNCKNKFEINAYLRTLQRFQCSPLIDVINVLRFKKLYLQNAYIDLHVWYTVGIKRSKSMRIYFAQKRNKPPETASQCNSCASCYK